MKIGLRKLVRLRAACALLALLAGWLSAPVALVGALDVCARACCVSEGHCCCKPRHKSVKGQYADERDSVGGVDVYKPCPDGCLTRLSSPSPKPGDSEHAAAHYVIPATPNLIHTCPAAFTPEPVEQGHSSPRAPPHIFPFQTA